MPQSVDVTTTTAEDGSYAFDGLDTSDGLVYAVSVTYQGILYSSGMVPVGTTAQQTSVISVFETTPDQSTITLASRGLLLNAIDSKLPARRRSPTCSRLTIPATGPSWRATTGGHWLGVRKRCRGRATARLRFRNAEPGGVDSLRDLAAPPERRQPGFVQLHDPVLRLVVRGHYCSRLSDRRPAYSVARGRRREGPARHRRTTPAARRERRRPDRRSAVSRLVDRRARGRRFVVAPVR